MNLTSERLINNAQEYLDRAQGDVDFDFSARLTQQSIAYSLLSIAQELKKFNDEADLERERKELLQAREERLAALG